MHFKTVLITFGIIVLTLMLAGCSKGQTDRKDNSLNSQSSASINGEKTFSNSNTSTLSTPSPRALSYLASIHMVDAMMGWTMSQGSLLRTVDGGVSWTNVTPKGVGSLSEGTLSVYDTQTVWVVFNEDSSTGIIVYRTTDGGRNWERSEINTNRPAYVTSLSFSDITYGWLLASYGASAGSEWIDVFKTSDGGASWKLTASANPNHKSNGIPIPGDKTGLTFADQKTGWITGYWAGDSVWFYTTHDGGTWAFQSIPIPKGYHTEGGAVYTYSPHFFGSKDGVLPVVFLGQALILYTSHDGGISWNATTSAESSQESLASYRGFQWSIIDAQQSIVSDGYKLYFTADGSHSFVSIKPNIDIKNLQQLDFVTEQLGWAIIDGGLWKTSDGGQNWTQLRR